MEGGLAVVRPKAVAQVRTPGAAQVSRPYLPHQDAAGVVPRGKVRPYLPRPACCFSVNPAHDAKAWPWWCLQRPDESNLDDRIVSQYKEVFEVFFEERGLIPPGHLHEVCFEELEEDPIGQLHRLYERLDLPDFASVEPILREYLRSLAGYKKNTF